MTTYSFVDNNATLAGAGAVLDLSGIGNSDEGISIEYADDTNTMTIGADGEGMHSLHASKAGTVTVNVLKTSPLNARLMALYNVQRNAAELHGQNVITINNAKTGETVVARQCAFRKPPANVYAKDGGTNAWVFDAIKIDQVLGLYK